MSGAALLVLAAGCVVYLWYRNDIGRARSAARRGSLIAYTTAGPIEYAEKGKGFPLLSRDCHVNLAPAERESKGSALVQAAVAARQF